MADPSLFDAASLPTHPARRTVNTYSEVFGSRPPVLAQVDSETSVDAAIANMPNRSGQRERVLAYLQEWGPATDEQIQDALGLEGSTERPRRVELARAGLIKKSGVAQTRSGRRACLWAAA